MTALAEDQRGIISQFIPVEGDISQRGSQVGVAVSPLAQEVFTQPTQIDVTLPIHPALLMKDRVVAPLRPDIQLSRKPYEQVQAIAKSLLNRAQASDVIPRAVTSLKRLGNLFQNEIPKMKSIADINIPISYLTDSDLRFVGPELIKDEKEIIEGVTEGNKRTYAQETRLDGMFMVVEEYSFPNQREPLVIRKLMGLNYVAVPEAHQLKRGKHRVITILNQR